MNRRWQSRTFLTLVVGTCALEGCASRQLALESIPEGAEVRTTSGEVLGNTPLKLESAQLDKVTQNGLLSFHLSAAGFMPLAVFTELHGSDSLRVGLTKLDDKFFREQIATAYAPQHNELAREILRVQNLVQTRKIEDATSRLNSFQEKFPFVATGYLMQANLDLLRKDPDGARRALSRARKLDPEDPVIARMAGGSKVEETLKLTEPKKEEPQRTEEPKPQ